MAGADAFGARLPAPAGTLRDVNHYGSADPGPVTSP